MKNKDSAIYDTKMHTTLHATLSQYKKIVLVGWWTGGHIQPIVSIVRMFESLNVWTLEKPKFLWIGWTSSTEEKAAEENNIPFRSISTLKLTTTRSWRVLLYPFYLMMGCWQARNILQYLLDWWNRWTGTFSTKSTENPMSENDKSHKVCLFSKWWPGSVAIGFAAWSLGIPVYIHESDTVPGRSNRILWKIAARVFLWFETAKKYFDPKKCEVVGQILDPVFWTSFVKEVSVGRRISSGKQNKISPTPLYKEGPNWKTTKPHILVICGSQGSRAIFQEIIRNYRGNEEYEWIISLGKLNTNMKSGFEKIPNCQALEWISQLDMAHLIQDTDIAITRWSATTLAELTIERWWISQKQEVQGRKIFSKGAYESVSDWENNFSNDEIRSFSGIPIKLIIIPLPYSSGNHQYYNALEYEKMGHTVLEQKNLNQITKIIQENV